MDSEEEEVVKKVLDNLRGYLQENLHVDVNFVSELEKRGLLLEQNAYQIRSTVETKESKDGVNGLLDYMSSFYDEETLETFCDFLEEYSKSTDPSLLTIANKIREEMIKQQVHPMGLTGSQQSDPSGPRGTGPLPVESSTPHPSETSQNVPGPSGTGPLPMESSTPHPSETTRDDDPRPSGSVPEFHAKSFMDKYKGIFLRCVHTLSIATRLKVDLSFQKSCTMK